MVIYGDAGMHKPEPEIYRLGAGASGCRPTRCVFVDDLRETAPARRRSGWPRSSTGELDSTLPELEELLGVELR